MRLRPRRATRKDSQFNPNPNILLATETLSVCMYVGVNPYMYVYIILQLFPLSGFQRSMKFCRPRRATRRRQSSRVKGTG